MWGVSNAQSTRTEHPYLVMKILLDYSGVWGLKPWAQVKAPAAHPADLSLIHGPYLVEELLKLSSDFHVCSIYRCKNNFQELDTD